MNSLSRPRPVLTASAIAGAVTGVGLVLTFLGYNEASAHLSAETQTITAIVIFAATQGSHLLAALHAQGKVTPTHDARADDGTPLVRADSVQAGFDSRPEPLPAIVGELVSSEAPHPDESVLDFTVPIATADGKHEAAGE